MAKYRAVYSKIWIDRDYMKLGKDGKLIFLYLITNPYINNSGIYEMPVKTISFDTGISCPTVGQLLGNGSMSNIIYDLENEIVYVKNIRKYNKSGNPLQVEKGVIAEFEENSKTFLWGMFIELNPQFKDKLSIIAQPLPNGSLPLPVPLDSNVLTNNKPSSPTNEKWFEEDWLNYPKGGNKKRARASYLKTVKTESDRCDFLRKTKLYIQSVDDPQYLKNGDTWFNQWEGYEVGPKFSSRTKAQKQSDDFDKILQDKFQQAEREKANGTANISEGDQISENLRLDAGGPKF